MYVLVNKSVVKVYLKAVRFIKMQRKCMVM